MNVLITELKKEIYANLTASEALALLPAQVNKIGRIQEYNKLDLITLVITGDIADRMTDAMSKTDEQLKMTETPELAAQYRYLARIMSKALDIDLIKADIYRINLGLPDIRAMFDGALSSGLLTADEHTAMLKLAEYKEGVDFSNYTLADVELARMPAPVFVEVTYVEEGHSNQHLVRAASQNSQAIELDFNITDGTKNVNFEIKTLSCTNLESATTKNDISNYQAVAAKWITRMGDNTTMIDHVEKNHTIKAVVKIFVKPSKPCEFTCVAR